MTTSDVTAITGGVGDAKLAAGLQAALAPGALTCIVNVGDDFEHLGLSISPDIDTLLYTLSGRNDAGRGWGRRDETWACLAALRDLGGPDWFALGDQDLALHILRSEALRGGATLSQVCARFARRLGIAGTILPASDAPVRTRVTTATGTLSFQDYFVRERAQPVVQALAYCGAGSAAPAPGVVAALTSADRQAIVICPSNPLLSIDPILAIPGVRAALAQRRVPAVAVSPLIGGEAVKGPTAKLFRELAIPRTAQAIAQHYAGLIDGLVIDQQDGAEAEDCGVPVCVTRTLMQSASEQRELATTVLAFARQLAASRSCAGS